MIVVLQPEARERARWLSLISRSLGRPVLGCRDLEELRAVASAEDASVAVVLLDLAGLGESDVARHLALVRERFPMAHCLLRSATRPAEGEEGPAGGCEVHWLPERASVDRVLLALQRLLPAVPSGEPAPLPLGDLLQLACAGEASLRVACLQGGRLVGHVDVVDGQPWDARDTVSDGEEALGRLLAGCEVGLPLRLSRDAVARRTLRGQCQQLMLDALRRHDEEGRGERSAFPSAEWDALFGEEPAAAPEPSGALALRRQVAEAILSGDRERAYELLEVARSAAHDDAMLRTNLTRLEALARAAAPRHHEPEAS